MTGQLEFRLTWTSRSNRVTLADLSLTVGGQPTWPVEGDSGAVMDCFADEVLAFLTDAWKQLVLSEAPPLPIPVTRPTELRRQAELRWARLPEAEVEREDDALWSFELAHNLARAFGGQSDVPPLWLVRQGRWMTLDTARSLRRVSLDAFIEAASGLGDEIADRLEERQPAEWASLVSAWRARDEGEPLEIEAARTGLDVATVRGLVRAGVLEPASRVSSVANDDSEVRAAARMVGGLPPAQIRKVLELAKALPITKAPALEELSRTLSEALGDASGRKPHEQGVLVAALTREHLGIAPDAVVDPFDVLRRLGVSWSEPRLGVGLGTLEALSIWGPRHGPAVIINAQSRRHQESRANRFETRPMVRVTAAHEICHLVMDRDGALAAVDILGGRMPLPIEQRARAFAAEFLLPASVAVGRWRAGLRRPTHGAVSGMLSELSRTFGVSKSVARWQLEHGLNGSEPDTAFWLNQIIPERM